MPWDPFSQLGSVAAQIVTDAWTASWLSVWNAGLWVLRLVLSWMDAWLTPDLSVDGPAHDLYQVTFWIAGVMVLVMFLVQLGIAAGRHDGKGLVRAGIGMGQFLVVTGGWIAYTVAITTAAGGLTRAVMEQVMGVTTWNSWEPWTSFDVKKVTDAGLATVLGLMGLLMWIAAIGHLLVILARDAALMVLVATGPITAAGLVNEGTRAWFWKAFRWFHVAAFTPLLVVIVTGVGMKFATGAASGKAASMEASVGTALPAIILISIAVVCPVALFKLLAFVDPGTASGASMRAGLTAMGGLQGLLNGNATAGADGTANQSAGSLSAGEASADAATTARVTSAVQQGAGFLGPIGAGLAVVCVQDSVADQLVEMLAAKAAELKLGPAYLPDSQLGPVITAKHRESVEAGIARGVSEGAELVLDGRGMSVDGYEGGFWVGPTILDHVGPNNWAGTYEIFGPVTSIKRVADFEEGINIMNANPFANGSCIYTSSGYHAREFARRTHAGMVGINVGIPVPFSTFPFTGHKESFFGDLHAMGKDGVAFFTETKAVTSVWFTDEHASDKVSTWDGTLTRG